MEHSKIYGGENDLYDYLVSHEDYQNNIDTFLHDLITSHNIKNVLELGVGSGRLTQLLCPLVESVSGFDKFEHMLEKANENLVKKGLSNANLLQGEHTNFELDAKDFDLMIAGWTLSYLTSDDRPHDMSSLEVCLNRVEQHLKNEGVICIIETLGTGNKEPRAPLKRLENMYEFLEQKGFVKTSLRTDYLFEEIERAKHCVLIFFDDRIFQTMESCEGGYILSECTGFWVKKLSDK